MGLNKEMTIFNAFITNVVAKGLPPEALEGVYCHALLLLRPEPTSRTRRSAKSAAEFTELYQASTGHPPDAYATIAYIAYMEMFRGFEAAKSFDANKVSAALLGGKASSTRSRVPPGGARITRPFKYAAFLVKGKGPERAEERVGSVQGRGLPGRRSVMPTLKSLGY